MLRCLDVVGDPTDLTVNLTTGLSTTTTREEKIVLQLMNVKGSFSTTIEVISCKKIGMLPAINFKPEEYEHLKQIPFHDNFPIKREMAIDLLIGEPMYSHLLCGGPVLDGYAMPGAQKTELGWALCGAMPDSSRKVSCHSIRNEERPSLIKIAETMNNFWNLQHLGITPPDANSNKYTAEEEDAIRVFEENAHYDVDNRKWTVALPWVNGRPTSNETGPIGNNQATATARMFQVERKTKPEDYEAVSHAYNEIVTRGWARKLSETEKATHDKTTYHLITRPVIKYERTTTPVRIVMDAGNKDAMTGKSLNDLLHQGPCLLPEIPHVLLRFRQRRWAFVLDVTKMFYCIGIPEEDQVFLRIIWRDFDRSRAPDVFQMLCYLFGLKCSPFVAIYCVLKLADYYEEEFSDAVELLRRQLFMDDVDASCDDKAHAKKMVNNLKELLLRGSFKAHKFASNAQEILADLPENDKTKDAVTKVLGIFWDTQTDEMFFQFDEKILSDEKVTKRTIMSQSAMLYDIMGWFQPFTVVYKMLLQEVWQLEDTNAPHKKGSPPRKIDYDRELEGELRSRWIKWKEQIPMLKKIRVPRWIGADATADISIAVFGDASCEAYGAVAYLLVTSQNSTTTTIAMSKSRLPPKELKPKPRDNDAKTLTIVRLELLAALLATRLGNYVAEALDVPKNKMHFFSDSLVNLMRIQASSPRIYKTWVAARITEINASSQKQNWHFCPGTSNPADIVSRGCSAEELIASDSWWKGPPWLTKRDEWPEQPSNKKSDADRLSEEKERKKNEDFEVYVHATNVREEHVVTRLNNKYNCFTKMVRVLAWMTRMIKQRKLFIQSKDDLTLQEVKEAEHQVIKFIQECSFPEEMTRLKKKQALSEKSKIKSFDPSLNEHGIMVHKSRLHLDEIDPHADATPLILPKNHDITAKIILDVHRKNAHSGTELTHMLIRRKY